MTPNTERLVEQVLLDCHDYFAQHADTVDGKRNSELVHQQNVAYAILRINRDRADGK